MDKSQLYNKTTSNTFSFLRLENKLNLKKIQQKKKQEHDKNVLSVYQKKQPNIQLINQCNRIMSLYKDHYNGNRNFSVFYEGKIQKNPIPNQEEVVSKKIQQLPSIHLERSHSTHDIRMGRGRSLSKVMTIVEAQKLMKPIKTNQYIDQKGFIKIELNKRYPIIKNNSSDKLNKQIFASSASFRNNSFKNVLFLSKQQQFEKYPNTFEEKKALLKKSSVALRKRTMHLKIKFRKNILLIIQKMKVMKVTLSDIIDKNIFDKTTPYKFGNEIFHAVKEGYQPKVFRIMMQNRFSIFSIDRTGKTTLMWACIRGYKQIMQLLLSNGVYPHERDMNGKTALYYSMKYNHLECAQMMFLYSRYIEPGIQSIEMSGQMRKVVRIGLLTHQYLTQFKTIDKKKEYFSQQYQYYFKQ